MLYFFAHFWEKVIKKLLTFCYWKDSEINLDQLRCVDCQVELTMFFVES